MTTHEQQPRCARAPDLRGQQPAHGKRINARLAAARGHVQGSRPAAGERGRVEQNYARYSPAGAAGGSFATIVFSRECPGWTVRGWAGLRPVVSGVRGWAL
jgi:hypothetical protein